VQHGPAAANAPQTTSLGEAVSSWDNLVWVNPPVAITYLFAKDVATALNNRDSTRTRLFAGAMAAMAIIPGLDEAGPYSRVLAKALEDAGFLRGAGEAAHHIVAGMAEAAAPARQVLARFGIGLNEASNGVFLPGTIAADNAAGAAVHSTLHTSEYYDAVNQALSQATSREGALQILNEIRSALLGGGYP
jgi:hypothetical protein